MLRGIGLGAELDALLVGRGREFPLRDLDQAREEGLLLVLRAPNPSFRAASCCSVDVVNGGAGDRFRSFCSTLSTR